MNTTLRAAGLAAVFALATSVSAQQYVYPAKGQREGGR